MCVCARTSTCGVYTHRRTHGCFYWLIAKLRFSNFEKKNKTNRSMVTTLSLFSNQLLLENVSSMLCHFTIVLTICRLVVKFLYMCQERADVMYSVKETGRKITCPPETDEMNEKRIVRYSKRRSECKELDRNHYTFEVCERVYRQ